MKESNDNNVITLQGKKYEPTKDTKGKKKGKGKKSTGKIEIKPSEPVQEGDILLNAKNIINIVGDKQFENGLVLLAENPDAEGHSNYHVIHLDRSDVKGVLRNEDLTMFNSFLTEHINRVIWGPL